MIVFTTLLIVQVYNHTQRSILAVPPLTIKGDSI
jgi:hypothetical protein